MNGTFGNLLNVSVQLITNEITGNHNCRIANNECLTLRGRNVYVSVKDDYDILNIFWTYHESMGFSFGYCTLLRNLASLLVWFSKTIWHIYWCMV